MINEGHKLRNNYNNSTYVLLGQGAGSLARGQACPDHFDNRKVSHLILKIGERLRVGIDESIRIHDKLLTVLSEHSVKSHWVEQEVETALAKERQTGRNVIFPVRIDNAVMEIESGWPSLIKNTRHIGDFRRWKDNNAYQKEFDRLLRDLNAEEGKKDG